MGAKRTSGHGQSFFTPAFSITIIIAFAIALAVTLIAIKNRQSIMALAASGITAVRALFKERAPI
jgi:hypothetical protein